MDSNRGHPPTTVTFIDNRLPPHHAAFLHPPVHVAPVSGVYVPNSQALMVRPGHGPLGRRDSVTSCVSEGGDPPPRPVWTDIQAMVFWNNIFDEAMESFRLTTTPPKGTDKHAYGIRDKGDWESVYDMLEAARAEYQKEGGTVRWLRKIRRRAADGIAPVADIARVAKTLAPDNPYSTPILGAVGVLLDSYNCQGVQISATIRQQALEGFDGLIQVFSDVELFLGTFPDDTSIRDSSVSLTVAVLVAIEQAICFFLSNEFLRGIKSLGSAYQEDLRNSLAMIHEKSRDLMKEAAKSHIRESHMYSKQTQKILQDVVRAQKQSANMMNAIGYLLTEHLQEKERQLKAAQAEMEAAQQEITFLRIENGILRSTSPSSYHGLPPPQQVTQGPSPVPDLCVSQVTLGRMLDIPDLDLDDMDFVADRKGQLPARQRVQAEQIISTRLFQHWVVSPSSAELLVHWDRPPANTVAGVSPLSVFCTIMTQGLRGRECFVSALWFCGLHADPSLAGSHIGGHAMVKSLVSQLLRQHAFDTRSLHRHVNIVRLQQGDFDELLRLLGWLVRQLPRTTTVVFLIDGAVIFEREQFLDEASRAFLALLDLRADLSLAATVKLLFTSTPGTDYLREAFEAENLILNVDALPRLVWAPSEERMARELDGGLLGNGWGSEE